jgi:predicted DNA-binding transcriptional regulator YafY
MQRMLVIHGQLQRGEYPNCSSLSRDLEVGCTKTVLRDITFMRDRFNLPIEYDRERHGYYYTRPVDQFPSVDISESELFALLVAQKAIAQYRGTPFHGPLQSAFRKLSTHLDQQRMVHLEGLNQAMEIRLSGPEEIDEEVFRIVSRAVESHRTLRFQYRKHATVRWEKRTANLYQLVCVNNRWYTIGLDLKRNAIRVFTMGRIRKPEILAQAFVRPADFRVSEYLKGSFGIFRGWEDFEVVVDLDRWAADIVRGRQWHVSQSITELGDGGLRLSFRLDNLEEIEPWILSWGAHARVVRPRALVERIRRTVRELAERYAPPRKQELPSRKSPDLPLPPVDVGSK